jgi:hypothetical protein
MDGYGQCTTHRIGAHYCADGLTISSSTYHDVPGGLPYVLAAVRDRLSMGAAMIEVRRIQERRQSEKRSMGDV